MLERTGRRALAPFRALVEVPANNVYVLPQDTIYLYREPQTFLAFGALGLQQQIPYGTWLISLAEAVARSGGLPDNQADPASVFLYRGETREVAAQLGIDVAKFEGPIIPVVYNLNLRDPAGYFLATTFEMRNKDVIYVSNAISVDATKWMNFFRTVNGTINDPISTAINVYTLKNLISGGASIITTTTTPTAPTAPAP
jgi:polysaccharide export outer membrane protein